MVPPGRSRIVGLSQVVEVDCLKSVIMMMIIYNYMINIVGI